MCCCMNLILQFNILDEQCNITGASSGEGTLFSCSSFRSSNSGFRLDSCATAFTFCCFIAYKFSRISFLLVSWPKKVQTPKVNGMTWLFKSKITPIFFFISIFHCVCIYILLSTSTFQIFDNRFTRNLQVSTSFKSWYRSYETLKYIRITFDNKTIKGQLF